MKKSKLRLITEFLRGSKCFFMLAVISAMGMVLTDMITPQIIRSTVDSVLGSEPFDLPERVVAFIDSIGGAAFLRERLWLIAICIMINTVFAVIFRYTFRVFNTLGAETLAQTMRNRIFTHIENLPFSWHMKNQTGDIIQRCTSDVDMIKNFLSEQLTSLFRIVIMLFLSVSFMLSMNVKLTFIALSTVPIVFAFSLLFHKKVSSRFTVCDENEGRLSAIAQENLTGVRVVRAFGRESYEKERFQKQNEKYASLWIHLSRLFSTYWSIADAISGVQIMLVVSVGAAMCVSGEMTSGAYIAFISYNSYLVWPIRQLGRTIAEMSKAGVSLGRIGEIMNSETEHDRENAQECDMHGDIVFSHVSYAYDDSHPVLDDVSFTVKAGTTVGILGGTGSGKSTLIHLLDRLYDIPDGSGSITVGGVDISDMPAKWVRKNIGMVLQEPFLFSRSISANIKIAASDNSDDAMYRASSCACLDETVRSFTDGYDTYVGERGVTLSGGQKQRVAIARMLMQHAPIMVFDDSLSAVDTETDARIRASLKDETGDSSVILISHRTTTLMHADLIVVLDHGKVAELGTHDELLARGGLYRKIYDIQNGNEVNVDG